MIRPMSKWNENIRQTPTPPPTAQALARLDGLPAPSASIRRLLQPRSLRPPCRTEYAALTCPIVMKLAFDKIFLDHDPNS